ncbi:MAG: T9SS type A sorting domain-containing protein [Crocinitomicaceae bacterium]|nr:T9SS type A sorting domain-containing protein [Crocinitomicaceae bacterium]
MNTISKPITFALLFYFTFSFASAQIISQFTWDSGSPTTADVGPNATGISASAVVASNGVGGTSGLNAGLPKMNIQMVLPGSPTFDVAGIDVSIDYQREENAGKFITRGSSLVMQGFGNFSVSYRVDDGSGGFNTVSSGNVYAIPNDNTFRTYRFYYLPTTGFGALLVDGVIQWSNDGPDGRDLYWTGSGDLVVGSGADGTGFNNTFFDNLIIASVTGTPLPVELVAFNAEEHNENEVDVQWQTASERNNDYFEVLKSTDGQNYESIGQVPGAGNSAILSEYSFTDYNATAGTIYYKLRQTDYDGNSEVFGPTAVTIEDDVSDETCVLIAYPNPCPGNCRVKLSDCPIGSPKIQLMMTDATGHVVNEIYDTRNFDGSFDIKIDKSNNLKPGIYIITASTGENHFSEKIIIN